MLSCHGDPVRTLISMGTHSGPWPLGVSTSSFICTSCYPSPTHSSIGTLLTLLLPQLLCLLKPCSLVLVSDHNLMFWGYSHVLALLLLSWSLLCLAALPVLFLESFSQIPGYYFPIFPAFHHFYHCLSTR